MLFAPIRGMNDPAHLFFSWLASEPAFVQVMLGIGFNLIVAPLAIAAVAICITKTESLLVAICSEARGTAAIRERVLSIVSRMANQQIALRPLLPAWKRAKRASLVASSKQ
jgi:hypothetical protein